MRRRGWIAVALIVAAGGVAAGILMPRSRPASPKPKLVILSHSEEGRRLLFAEVQPVALGNCELERFGEENDGGYQSSQPGWLG